MNGANGSNHEWTRIDPPSRKAMAWQARTFGRKANHGLRGWHGFKSGSVGLPYDASERADVVCSASAAQTVQVKFNRTESAIWKDPRNLCHPWLKEFHNVRLGWQPKPSRRPAQKSR